MKRILVCGVAATFLLVSILASSAMAHNFVANTSLTIHKAPTGATHPGHDVVIFGKLRSGHHSCEVHKVVRLMKKRPGPDKLLGRDRTDTEGDYSFLRNPTRDMTVYTRFRGSLNTSYGHSHECLASRSSNLFINIR
jgi:hypothetical protein